MGNACTSHKQSLPYEPSTPATEVDRGPAVERLATVPESFTSTIGNPIYNTEPENEPVPPAVSDSGDGHQITNLPLSAEIQTNSASTLVTAPAEAEANSQLPPEQLADGSPALKIIEDDALTSADDAVQTGPETITESQHEDATPLQTIQQVPDARNATDSTPFTPFNTALPNTDAIHPQIALPPELEEPALPDGPPRNYRAGRRGSVRLLQSPTLTV